MEDLRSFFEPQHFIETQAEETYESMQLGANVICLTQESFDWDDADIVLVGCNEWRGDKDAHTRNHGELQQLPMRCESTCTKCIIGMALLKLLMQAMYARA
jgi:hypothetical protein